MAKYVGNGLKILNGEVYNGTILTDIDIDYTMSQLLHDAEFYFTPTQDRVADITAGALSVGTSVLLYHAGLSDFKQTVIYDTNKSIVLTRNMYTVLKRVPNGWLFTKESNIGKMGHGYFVPRGAVELSGQLRTKDALWHYIKEYYSQFIVTETVWQGGDCLKFVDYSSVQYRIPDFRGIFERNSGTNSKLKMANGTPYTGGDAANILLDMILGHFHDFYTGNTNDTFGHPNNQSQIAKAANSGGRMLDSETTAPSKDIINKPKSDTINGTPNTGPENRPVSGSKIAFIYAED